MCLSTAGARCHQTGVSCLGAQMNGLQMIVRAHECVMDGFERFAQGHLITLFSATNYCGTANNAGVPCRLAHSDTTSLQRLLSAGWALRS